jgi:hypothetical protein
MHHTHTRSIHTPCTHTLYTHTLCTVHYTPCTARAYYAATTHTDQLIGSVLDHLHTLSLDASTVVLFFTDHGYHLGEHNLYSIVCCDRFILCCLLPHSINSTSSSTSSSTISVISSIPTLCSVTVSPRHSSSTGYIGYIGNTTL